ncbi:FmdB family zinc ribbon protein [Thermomonospora umbrina]|uniref:Putative FmdB family regulatory protein n=1 Tax=Thermomonospora umbrina TaxID=111806 RepID=A0A3D9SK16_9ACTN|nr:FmdB family zinc ribbon protein [Thermomonospora umbrina]REE96229.1 putative FmdB family regulatory protein [Thermomonospora umbrina]
MPTYQYVCTECGEPLEVVQKFSDDALTECPACSGKLRKVFSAAGIIFKGSGFYRTDSRGGGKSPASTTPSSSTDSPSTSKSESAAKSGASTDGGSSSSSSGSGSASSSGSGSGSTSGSSSKVA